MNIKKVNWIASSLATFTAESHRSNQVKDKGAAEDAHKVPRVMPVAQLQGMNGSSLSFRKANHTYSKIQP